MRVQRKKEKKRAFISSCLVLINAHASVKEGGWIGGGGATKRERIRA